MEIEPSLRKVLPISCMFKNLSFSLVESNTGQETPSEVTYDSLLSLVNEQTKNIQEDYGTQDLTLDDYIACELDYKENYTKC